MVFWIDELKRKLIYCIWFTRLGIYIWKIRQKSNYEFMIRHNFFYCVSIRFNFIIMVLISPSQKIQTNKQTRKNKHNFIFYPVLFIVHSSHIFYCNRMTSLVKKAPFSSIPFCFVFFLSFVSFFLTFEIDLSGPA